jgi:hypothetical protein
VRDAIWGAGPNPVPPAQAVALMAALQAGADSARTGQALPLPLSDAEVTAFQEARAVGAAPQP